jgi:hypothetical protein
MTTLYISEFASVAQDIGRGAGILKVLPMPPIAQQTVAIGDASEESAPFSSETHVIRVVSDTTCSIVISRGKPAGGAPVAALTHMRIAANAAPEIFGVQPGSVLAVIENT